MSVITHIRGRKQETLATLPEHPGTVASTHKVQFTVTLKYTHTYLYDIQEIGNIV